MTGAKAIMEPDTTKLKPSAALPRLSSLWVGEKLSYTEQLCMRSAIHAGHAFTLYSYTPDVLQGVPADVELRDAREVMPVENLVSYSDTGSYALGANFFRYALLSKGGYCVDMDFCFVRPLDFSDDYVFGWEHEGWINNAVLRSPADCAFVRDLCAIPATNVRPPWFGPKRSLKYFLQRLTRGPVRVQDLPWGTYSSGMVTYLAKRQNLTGFAHPPSVFYPVRWRDARLMFDDRELVEKLITAETRAVHMWHSRIIDLASKPPPRGSYVAAMCDKFGVDTMAP